MIWRSDQSKKDRRNTMRYKNEDANRYRVNFMIATEKLMDKLTVREFISYLEEKAEFEDTTHEYNDGKVV